LARLPNEFHLKSNVLTLRLVFNALAIEVPASAVRRLLRKSNEVKVLLGNANVADNARKPSGNKPNEFHSNDNVRSVRFLVKAWAKATAPVLGKETNSGGNGKTNKQTIRGLPMPSFIVVFPCYNYLRL
jgi:hypothetical protein